jgi:hypothetical protein
MFRVRCETQTLMTGAQDALAKSLELLTEVDAVLANISARLRQPKQEPIPADLPHVLPWSDRSRD